jgi:hypothetical protein
LKYYAYILIAFFSLTWIACKKTTVEQPPDFGFDYFPIEVGRYNVYQVDSVIYNIPFDTIYRYSFQVKELNESLYKDSEEKESVRLERYYRNTPSDAWVLKNVWSSRFLNGKAERQEENIRLIKLAFPLLANKSWNINAVNTLDEQIAEIEKVDSAYQLSGVNYPNTVSVILATDTNRIFYKTHKEVYAKGIGLIYSEFYELYSNNIDPDKPSVTQRIETGTVCTRKLIETGKQ